MTAVFDFDDIADAVARGLDAVRDFPQPANDALCSDEAYARLGAAFQDGAWKHLDEKDLPQASNKAWALVAETVKAIALHHGRVIHSHRGLIEVVEELARLPAAAGDTATQHWIINAFQRARGLHSNFYENRDSELSILAGLMLCEQLSARLYHLFWQQGGAVAAAAD